MCAVTESFSMHSVDLLLSLDMYMRLLMQDILQIFSGLETKNYRFFRRGLLPQSQMLPT